jgi:molybdate transport system substrate-binding protein
VACDQTPERINVAAASSLQDVMREIASRYEAETHEHVALNFGGSNILARQIRAGAPADVFIAADEKQQVNAIETRPLVANQLVVVSVAPFHDLRELQRIAIGDPHAVPAGVYAREYLEREKLWDAIEPKLIPMENVRAALAAVDNGSVDAAFVYRTDAMLAKRARVVMTIDGLRIVDPAMLLHERGRGFYQYLFGKDAVALFHKYGFRSSDR